MVWILKQKAAARLAMPLLALHGLLSNFSSLSSMALIREMQRASVAAQSSQQPLQVHRHQFMIGRCSLTAWRAREVRHAALYPCGTCESCTRRVARLWALLPTCTLHQSSTSSGSQPLQASAILMVLGSRGCRRQRRAALRWLRGGVGPSVAQQAPLLTEPKALQHRLQGGDQSMFPAR